MDFRVDPNAEDYDKRTALHLVEQKDLLRTNMTFILLETCDGRRRVLKNMSWL